MRNLSNSSLFLSVFLFLSSNVLLAQIPVIDGQNTTPSTNEEQSILMQLAWLDVTDNNVFPDEFTLIVRPGSDYSIDGSDPLLITPNADIDVPIQVIVAVMDIDGNTSGDFSFDLTVNPVNDPPMVSQANTGINIDEGSNVTLTLSDLTITDPDDNTFTLQVKPGSNYTFVGNQVTPDTDFFGTLTVNLVVNDGQSDSNVLGFMLDVNPINDEPTLAAIGNINLAENDVQQDIALTGITSGATNESQTLTVTVGSTNPGLFSTLNVVYTSPNSTGTLQLQPAADQFGMATVTVTVTDSGPGSPPPNDNSFFRQFTVTVSEVNNPPTLNAISNVTVNEDVGAQVVNLSGISPGSGESGSQTVNITAVSDNTALIPNPSVSYDGTSSTGSITFQPVANESGSAQITVTATDDGSPNMQVVRMFTITVNPVNDAPTLNAISNVSVPENAPNEAIPLSGITAGPSQESGQTLSVNASITNSSNFTLSVVYTSPASTGTLNIQPDPGYSGVETVTVTVQDNGGTANGGVNSFTRQFTFTVNSVNDPPTLDPIANVTVNEDAPQQTVNLTGITAGPGEGSQTVVITATSDNTALIPNPTVNYSSGSTGSLNYQPVSNQSGSADITVTATDNGSPAMQVSRIFTITVNEVNDPPTLNALGDVTVNENAPNQAISLAGIASGPPQESSQTLTVNASITSSGNFTLSVVYTSPNTTGTLNIQPNAGYSGTATVTVTVQDNGGTSNGGINTFTRQFDFIVNDVNDPPTLNPIADVTINEDAAQQTVNLSGISAGSGEGSQSVVVTATSNNTTLIPNPTVNYTSGSTGSLNYQPAANRSGSADITVTVTDNGSPSMQVSQVFTITVNEVNDPPTLNAISNVTVNENAPLQSISLAGISDGSPFENQNLTVVATNNNPGLFVSTGVVYVPNNSSGTLNIQPKPFTSGTATFTVTVTDNGSNSPPSVNTFSRQFTFTITDFNDPPSFDPISNVTVNEDAGSQNVNINNVSSGPGESQNVTLTATSSNTTLIPDPSIAYDGTASTAVLTFVPAANRSGSATITVRAVDSGSAEYQDTFVITVQPVNDAPTLAAIGPVVMQEDDAAQNIALSGITAGPLESQVLTVTASSDNTSLIPNPTVTYTSPQTTGSLSVQPLPNATGSATITVTVTDNGSGVSPNVNTFSQQFTITVNDANDPPTFAAIADVTINEDAPGQNVNITGISPGPGENQQVTITATSDNTTLIPNPIVTYAGTGSTGSLAFQPAGNRSGSAIITVRAVDEEAAEFSRTFTITVTPVNDPPTIDAISDVSVQEDAAQQAISFTGISAGPFESQLLNLTASSDNPGLFEVFTVSYTSPQATGTLDIKPNPNGTGSAVVTVTVTDNGSNTPPNDNTTSITFTINVTPVNDPPVITGQTPVTINEDNTFTILPTHLTIVDPDNSSGFTVSASSGPNYTVSGTTITPNPDYYGVLTVPVTVSDGTNSSAPFNFQITVSPVNDPPVITGQVAINIAEAQPFDITLNQLEVDDVDNNYPADFTLIILAGSNYSVTGTTVTPIANFSGVLQVPVFVNDGQANSNTFTMQIQVNSVNDPPVINSQLTTLTIDEDQSITLALTDLDVSDPDNNYPADFTMSVLSGTDYTFNNLVVTPNANFNGPLTVRVSVNDGQISSSPFNMLVTVNPVNDAPLITGQNLVTTEEDTPVTLKLTDLIVMDPDVDDPYPGTFTMSASSGPDYTVSGLTITPGPNFSGTLSVPVVVNDGEANSNTFNLQIQVSSENDPPVITAQVPLPLTTPEDTPVTITLSNLEVTDDDNTYPDGFSIIIQSGADYTFSGTTITPALDFTGTLNVSLMVNDGTSNSAPFNFEISVIGENDPPVITGQKQLSMAEDGTLTITLNDLEASDPDNDPLTLSVMPGTNYTFTGTTIQPNANYFGTLTVIVRVSDGTNNSAPYNLQVQVTPVNDPPSFDPIADIIIAENTPSYNVQITNISSGPNESQQLTPIVTSNNTNLIPDPMFDPPYNGTATSATLVLKPVANQTGTAVITVRFIDAGLLEVTHTFTVQVQNINDPPTLDPIAYGPIPEDSPLQSIPLTGITAGPGESQVLTVTASTNKPELFETFEVVYTSPQGTGMLKVLPKPNAFGNATITVTVTDDGSNQAPNVNFITRTFTLNITPVNDPPVFQTDPIEIALVGEEYEYLIEVTDADAGSVITIQAPQKPAWLTLTTISNGKASLKGTPPPGSTGSVMVSLSAKDDANITVTQDFLIIIDTRPLIVNFSFTVNEDEQKVIDKLKFDAAFTDADNDVLQKVKIVKLPAHGQLFEGTAAINVDQEIDEASLTSLSYRPFADYAGPDTVEWNGSDGYAYAPVRAKIFITVLPVNDPPVIVALESTVLTVNAGEGPVVISTEFEASDVDNEFLTGAEIRFRMQNFVPQEDILIFENTTKITGTYDPVAGILTLTGTATVAEYNEAIRSIKYDNISSVFSAEEVTKAVSYTVSDGPSSFSVPRDRELKLIDTFEELSIPNGFTPNSDGSNDTWLITNIDRHVDASVKVYNMMGQVVYSSEGNYFEWDGTYNGNLLPTDTYYYTIDLNLPFRKKVYKGAVTILR